MLCLVVLFERTVFQWFDSLLSIKMKKYILFKKYREWLESKNYSTDGLLAFITLNNIIEDVYENYKLIFLKGNNFDFECVIKN